MTEVKIEKNVPMPKARHRQKWPFGEMEVGDSLFSAEEGYPRGRSKAANAAWAYGRAHGKKFAVRKVKGGFRVWRIE